MSICSSVDSWRGGSRSPSISKPPSPGSRELREDLGSAETGSDEEILEGLLHIADERMAEAIRHISVRKGIDPAGYSLVAFGGAGGNTPVRSRSFSG